MSGDVNIGMRIIFILILLLISSKSIFSQAGQNLNSRQFFVSGKSVLARQKYLEIFFYLNIKVNI